MHDEIGYFKDFKDRGETILIDGDSSALLALSHILRGLEAPDVEPVDKIEAVAEGVGGHNWLEYIGVEDAVVMVSTIEYGRSWWLKWG